MNSQKRLTELDEYLIYRCDQGFKSRGLEDKGPEYKERLEFELKTILSMGFAGYFLIVWDVVNAARNMNIPVGPGRGSIAGCLVAYCLYIHNLDPIRWKLMFERFLNPHRISMPDIDLDFCEDKRELVFKYVMDKYGEDRVAHIGTFGSFKARGCIKAATRTLGLPIKMGVDLCSLLLGPVHGKPQPLNTSLDKVDKLKTIYNNTGTDKSKILHWGQKIENLISNRGIHAAGIVISNNPLSDQVPLFKSKYGEISTQWEMNNIEEAGLIKFDFLGLKALTKISQCIELVKESYGIDIVIDAIGLEDEKVYEELRAGNTQGIFQLEGSTGIVDLLVKIQPVDIEDIIAINAIYRPGPLASPEVKHYLKVRAGTAEPHYLVPELEPILSVTNGLVIFQEQAMKIATDLCGYSLPEADDFRKAIGKKLPEKMRQHKSKFQDGWNKNGLPPAKGRELFNQLEAFASYAFNRAHSAAYSMITYQTAWLKVNYPTEFMCACLTCETDNKDQIIKYLAECKRIDINVLPPHVNESQDFFSVVDGAIRFGLAPVKNLGAKPVAQIIQERSNGDYKEFIDFCTRVDLSIINRLKIESLIKAGAMDGLHTNRASMMGTLDEIYRFKKEAQGYKHKYETFVKRTTAFEERLEDIRQDKKSLKGKKLKPFKEPAVPPFPQYPELFYSTEMHKNEILAHEHELTGFFISGHPLDGYDDILEEKNLLTIEKIKDPDNEYRGEVSIGSVITSHDEITTKKLQQMAFATIEDTTGQMEIVIFPNVYSKYRDLLEVSSPLIVSGKPQKTFAKETAITKLIVSKIETLDRIDDFKSETLRVDIPLLAVEEFISVMDKHKGTLYPLEVSFRLQDNTRIVFSDRLDIDDIDSFVKSISGIIYGTVTTD